MGRQDAETETLIPTTGAAFDETDGVNPTANQGGVAVAFAQNQHGEVRVGDVANTLNTNSNASGRNTPMVALPIDTQNMTEGHTSGGKGFGESGDPSFTLTKGHSYAVAYGLPGNWIGRKPENGGNATEFPEERSPSLTATDRHGVVKAFTASEQSNSYAWERDVYPTLDAQVPNDTSNIQKGIRSDMAVRRLTPLECERLQGFPDGYTDIPGASDSARYKALGNSMAVPVMRWIGQRIDAVHKGEDTKCS